MKKKIYFCVDENSMRILWDKGFCPTTYERTDEHIKEGLSPIITNSMAHFSFDLIEQGYDIYLCYGNKNVKIAPHMDLSGIGEPCKDLKIGHNILKLFRAGAFNELLGIKATNENV